MADIDTAERGEITDYQRTLEAGGPWTKPFDSYWEAGNWTKWATVRHAMRQLEILDGASVLDVGCGEGWTTLFLSEAGYRTVGIDFAPAAIEIARRRSTRWQTREQPRFAVADMEQFDLGQQFDFVLVFEALHHVRRRREAVQRIGRHVRQGGYVLFGEPSWLHSISPEARRVAREDGWVEKGVPLSQLKRDCRSAGLGHFRRFFEGTVPYDRRVLGFWWQLIRLAAANEWVAPKACIWLAAQRV